MVLDILKNFFFKLIDFERAVTLEIFAFLVWVTLKSALGNGFSANRIDARRTHDAILSKMERFLGYDFAFS